MPLRLLVQKIDEIQSRRNSHIAASLAFELSHCSHLFSISEPDTKSREGSDTIVLIHKFKTQVTALFNDKRPEQRYAAVVLAHAAVQVGGLTILKDTAPWVRALLGILKVKIPQNSIATDKEWDSPSTNI